MDPREVTPMARRANHSPLLTALMKRASLGEVVNVCPFQCQDHELDENGFCGHLIGFYNGGQTYEPRVKRKKDGRIITSGANRQPMKRGYVLKKISTTARVYSPEKVKDLTPNQELRDAERRDLADRERELMRFADQIRNPVLEGEWEGSIYEPAPVAAAAGPPKP